LGTIVGNEVADELFGSSCAVLKSARIFGALGS
jgi:hypothetical protein